MDRIKLGVLCALLLAPVAAVAQEAEEEELPALSSVDVFAVTKTDLDITDPDAPPRQEDDGDGYGVRALIRAGAIGIIVAEYQGVAYDASDLDRDEMRAGLGVATPEGTGAYIEYASTEFQQPGGTNVKPDGLGAHIRLVGNPLPKLQLYADGGFLLLEDDDDRYEGQEFTIGAAYSVLSRFGVFVDYKQLTFDARDSNVESKFVDVRAGARIFFGGGGGKRAPEEAEEEEAAEVVPADEGAVEEPAAEEEPE